MFASFKRSKYFPKYYCLPTVIPNSLRLTRPPLLLGVDISAMYMHSAIADSDTAKPKTNRPKSTDERLEAKATINAPNVNRSAFNIIVNFRP